MSGDLVALVVALTPIVIALIAVWRQVLSTHHLVNSRMDELLELTRQSSLAKGRLERQ